MLLYKQERGDAMPQTNSVPSQFICIECDKVVSRKDILWSHKAEQFDGATCICEDCFPKWQKSINPPDLEHIENTQKKESFIAHYLHHTHEQRVKHREEKELDKKEHAFAEFVRVSLEDPSMSSILLAMANLTTDERHSLLDVITTQLEHHDAKPELIDALHTLKLDDMATRIIEMMENRE